MYRNKLNKQLYNNALYNTSQYLRNGQRKLASNIEEWEGEMDEDGGGGRGTGR